MNIVIDYDKVTINGVAVPRPSGIDIERWYRAWELFDEALHWNAYTWEDINRVLGLEE